MAASPDDSMAARISKDCPLDVREVLHRAWAHDLAGLKKLLGTRERANAQDPRTGETPLHAAIRACGPAASVTAAAAAAADDDDMAATAVLRELFASGAIWNDVDANDETPGCVAHRLGRSALYRTCVESSVCAEMLFALMDGYEELSSSPDQQHPPAYEHTSPSPVPLLTAGEDEDKPVTSEAYLQSYLTYDTDKLLDADRNAVMMSWETDIMRLSVAALVPAAQPAKRILNIGFGMGIIDSLFAQLQPARHHIIEAHSLVLRHLADSSDFGPSWEQSAAEQGARKVHAGKWQDVVSRLLEQGEVYDAIYFDNFGEDYAQLRNFFTEYVPGLLDQHGRFSFFNGLGADRRICYDIYSNIVNMHCADAGLDVEWIDLDVDSTAPGDDGKARWKGVRRPYWTLDSSLPTFEPSHPCLPMGSRSLTDG